MRGFFKLDRKPKITNNSDKIFVKVKVCWLCDREFGTKNDKIKHYSRLSGDYLAAAHQSCIDYANKSNQYILIQVLHQNFSKFDNLKTL